MSKNRARMTPIQIQMLVDILFENSELATGKLTANFSRDDRHNKWEAVATLLNSKGLGPQKTSDQWRKSWSDLKHTIRSKASKIELIGGTDLMNEKLTNLEKRVLQLSGDITIDVEGNETKVTKNLKDLEADLIKTEEDLMKAMKKPNQIVLPYSVSKFFETPAEIHITMPIVENIAAQEKTDENNCTDEARNDDYVEDKSDDGLEANNGDSDDDITYDDDVIYDEETADDPDPVEEPLSPPPKRKRLSPPVDKASSTSSEPKSFISVFQKQIETQTTVLKEQTSIMQDIAKSLRLIARSLHNS